MKTESILKFSLKNCYEKSKHPVIFIKKDFKPFYYNEVMKKAFPSLCKNTSIKELLTEESVLEFLQNENKALPRLQTKEGSFLSSFSAEPIYDDGEIVCYQISSVAFGNTSVSSESFSSNFFSKYAEKVVSSFEDANKTLEEVKKNSMMRDFEKYMQLSDIITDAHDATETIRINFSRLEKFSEYGKTYFRLSSVLSELSKSLSALCLPRDFIEDDDKTVIFGSKGGISEALISSCRFLVLSSGASSKINSEIIYNDNKTILHLFTSVSKEEIKPYETSFSENGIYNYGLAKSREYIERQNGNFLVIKKKNRLSIYLSFPTVNPEILPQGIFDNQKSGFRDFSWELFELSSLCE